MSERYIPQEELEAKITSVENSKEIKPEIRPNVLFRSVSINPEELSVERLRQTLIPGTVSKDDPTKINDGNELGVYMTTNSRMAESVYARGGRGVSKLEIPQLQTSRGILTGIELPSCGIVYEIETTDLQIRKPKITSVLQGVYNNGFEGDEWIADTIPANHYKIKKLFLSRYANDSKTFSIDIIDQSEEALTTAIEVLLAEYEKRKQAAEQLRDKLSALSEKERLNYYKIQKMLEEYEKG